MYSQTCTWVVGHCVKRAIHYTCLAESSYTGMAISLHPLTVCSQSNINGFYFARDMYCRICIFKFVTCNHWPHTIIINLSAGILINRVVGLVVVSCATTRFIHACCDGVICCLEDLYSHSQITWWTADDRPNRNNNNNNNNNRLIEYLITS